MAVIGELAEHLVNATEAAANELEKIRPNTLSRKDRGDIVTNWDLVVHESFCSYFDRRGIRYKLLGEEGCSGSNEPEIAILLDEIEGTQNAVNSLPFGINAAAGRYRHVMTVDDMEAAVVANIPAQKRFVSTRGRGGYVLEKGIKRTAGQDVSDIFEVPLGYVDSPDVLDRQIGLFRAFQKLFGAQYRSIDATGTRLAEIGDGNIRVYGDWREATKPWDVIPSARVLGELGVEVTDIFGFSLGPAVLVKDGELNMEVGKTILAGRKEDHAKALNAVVRLYLRDRSPFIGGEFGAARMQAGFHRMGYTSKDVAREIGKYYAGVFRELVERRQEKYSNVLEGDARGLRKSFSNYLKGLGTPSDLCSNNKTLLELFGSYSGK